MDMTSASCSEPLPNLDPDWVDGILRQLDGPMTIEQLLTDFKSGLLHLANDSRKEMGIRHRAMEWYIETSHSEKAIAARRRQREEKECMVYNVRVVPLLTPVIANKEGALQRAISRVQNDSYYFAYICEIEFSRDSPTCAWLRYWPLQSRHMISTIMQERVEFLLSTPGALIEQVIYNLALPTPIEINKNTTYYGLNGLPKRPPDGFVRGKLNFSLSVKRRDQTTLALGLIMKSFNEYRIVNEL